MATLQWGTTGYVKHYFVSRQGGDNDDGSLDSEHRPCFTVAEVQEVICRHEEDYRVYGDMAYLTIETCIEVPGVGEFWAEGFRPEWTPGTQLYRVWQCWVCDKRHPRYQWTSRLFSEPVYFSPFYTCKMCGYDPADYRP